MTVLEGITIAHILLITVPLVSKTEKAIKLLYHIYTLHVI